MTIVNKKIYPKSYWLKYWHAKIFKLKVQRSGFNHEFAVTKLYQNANNIIRNLKSRLGLFLEPLLLYNWGRVTQNGTFNFLKILIKTTILLTFYGQIDLVY